MPKVTDPWRRKAKSAFSDLFKPKGSTDYQGQDGLELLFEQMMPQVLVRTDPRIDCVCQGKNGTGEKDCERCFGTGKVITSLDKFPGYVSHSSPGGGAPSTNIGWVLNDTKKIYAPRWLYPSVGDLVLEVGWDVRNEQVYSQGRVNSVDNVYQVKQVNNIGFQMVSYTEMFTVYAQIRREDIENLLLFGKDLPVWIDKNKD